jgi:hypothetical protein
LNYDYLIQTKWINDPSPQNALFEWHHIIGGFGLFVGMTTGYGITGVGLISLIVEISTIFINYRGFYRKDEMAQFVPQVIQIIFFILYTIFRMCLFPYMTYNLALTLYYAYDYLEWYRKVTGAISLFFFLLMWALNTYWYKLIVVGLLKLLGIIKVDPKKKKISDSTPKKE